MEARPRKAKGRLIIIEGLDGSGKNTQAKLLAEALQSAGGQVRMVSFPNYDSDSSALIKMYLSGKFGTQPDAVNAYAASTFFAVDRYASWKQDWGDLDLCQYFGQKKLKYYADFFSSSSSLCCGVI